MKPLTAPTTFSAAALATLPSQPAHVYAPYQTLIAGLQSYLTSANLGHYLPFALYRDVFDDQTACLITQAWPQAAWIDLAFHAGVSSFSVIEKNTDEVTYDNQPYGLCHLRDSEIIIARIHCLDSELHSSWLTLAAAPSYSVLHAFLDRLRIISRDQRRQFRRWISLSGLYNKNYARPIDEPAQLQDLILADALVQAINQQAIGFFTPSIQALHEKLGLPRIRKTLFYGPPGTGKTSLCQAIARAVPGVNAYHLTPDSHFNDDYMSEVYKHIVNDGPSILLIEDLDSLVTGSEARINTSNFLNLLDGVNSPRSGPALILSTTNHPDKLPESLINRPGRFMPIHVPLPDKVFRLRYLQLKLPDMPQDVLASLASTSQDLSYAHLQEIVLLSGIIAMNDGRDTRLPTDLTAAASHVTGIGESAKWGFPTTSEKPFGFARSPTPAA